MFIREGLCVASEDEEKISVITSEEGKKALSAIWAISSELKRDPQLKMELEKCLAGLNTKNFRIRVDAPAPVLNALNAMDGTAFPCAKRALATHLMHVFRFAIKNAEEEE